MIKRGFRFFRKNFEKKKVFIALLIISIFLLFTIFNTYPLIKKINTHQLGDGGDGVMIMWDFWWMKISLTELHQNPFHTDYIFFPSGTDLYLQPLVPLMSLLAIPIMCLFNDNLIFTYNLLSIFNFILAGFGMFLLTFYLTKNKPASFIAGYIFAFSPYAMSHALGHFNLMSMGFIPFFILYFIKFHEEPSKKNLLFSSLFLIFVTLCAYYYGFFMVFFAFIYEIYYLILKKFKVSKRFIFKLFLIFLIYLLVLFPIFVGVFESVNSNKYFNNHNPDYWGPDVMSFFVPGSILRTSSFFRGFDWWKGVKSISVMGAENQNFLGYTLIALSMIGFIFARKKKIDVTKRYYLFFFVILGLISFIFALGTKLKFFGKAYDFKLPYYYFYKFIPVLSVSGRFTILVVLSIAIISAFAITHLAEKISSKRKIIFYALIFGLVFFEFFAMSSPMKSQGVSEFYLSLANEPGDFAIYDLSHVRTGDHWLYDAGIKHMYYQTFHKKRIITGNSARMSIQGYMYATSFPFEDLRDLNVKYVIFDNYDNDFINRLEQTLIKNNFLKVFEDKKIIVYQVF